MTPVRIPHWTVMPISGYNITSVTIQHGIKTRCHNSTGNLRPGVTIPCEILIRVTIQCEIMTWGHTSTLSYDPGSQFNVELWPGVTIQRGIMTRVIVPHCIMIQIPGHNWTSNHDSGSQFNVELRPGVIIQRGIKTWGHNSTGGLNFIRRRGRNTMTPCLGGSQFNMKNPLKPEHSPLN